LTLITDKKAASIFWQLFFVENQAAARSATETP
jgi:hypothetical protein